MRHFIGGTAAGIIIFILMPGKPKNHDGFYGAMLIFSFTCGLAAWGLLP